MCPSYDPPQCNRQPFLSESGCDRGSVDIHRFDELPYCEKIDPTPPDIPPEIVDTPIDVVVPPSCSCISIDYKLDFKYNKEREFVAKGEFSAKGDCCEGNYGTTFDVQIPCPVVGKGSKKIDLKIKYGDGSNEHHGTYIEANSESCAIDAKDIDISLDLPCPVKDQNGKIRVGIQYGDGAQSGEGSLLETDHESCTIKGGNPDINLNLPCPVGNEPGKIKVGIQYGKGAQSGEGSILKADRGNCTVNGGNPDIRLNLPCPVGNEPGRIKVGIQYGKGAQSGEGSILKADPGNCTVNGGNPDINLNLPCPINGRAGKSKIKAKLGWGNKSSDSASFIDADPENCAIEPLDASLNLNLKCPLENLRISTQYKTVGKGGGDLKVEDLGTDPVHCTRNIKLIVEVPSFDLDNLDIPCPLNGVEEEKVRVAISYGSDPTRYDISAPVVRTDAEACTVVPLGTNYRLNIPCPFRGDQGKRKIKARIKYGSNSGSERSSVSASFANKGKSCSFSLYGDDTKEVSLKLRIQCPIKTKEGKKKIKARIKYGLNSGSEGSSVSASYANKGHSCSISFYGDDENSVNLKLRIKCPIKSDIKGWRKLRIKTKLGSYSTSNSISFIKVDSSSCTIEFDESETQKFLNIPCPVFKSGRLKLRFKKPVYKYEYLIESSSVELVSFDSTKCRVNPADSALSHSFEMKIPCPTTESRLDITTSYRIGTSKSPSPSFHTSDSFQNDSCKRNIVFKLKFPYIPCKNYVTALRYDASKHALQYKTYNTCTYQSSEWMDIFTAVAHMTDHTCCNDA